MTFNRIKYIAFGGVLGIVGTYMLFAMHADREDASLAQARKDEREKIIGLIHSQLPLDGDLPKGFHSLDGWYICEPEFSKFVFLVNPDGKVRQFSRY